MNPFNVGDKVRFRFKGNSEREEFIVTGVDVISIGFVSNYPKGKNYKEIKEGELAYWHYSGFELVQSAEDVDFDNRIKDLDESV